MARLRIPHNTIIKLTPYVPHIIPFGHSAVSHALFIPHGFKDYCDSKPLLALSDIAAITARCASLYLEPTSPARLHEGLVAAARAQLLLDANVTPKSEDDPYFDYIQSLIGKSKRGLAPYQRLLESLRNVRFSESHSTYFSN